MKKEQQEAMAAYEAPRVEVVEVQIENGFAASAGVSGVSIDGWGNGGSIGGNNEAN